ncbi:ankyrin repeat-containing protein BDA1-like [Vicia villosa]|uniref:ankyrin repeat-containing protein BDA1-like n=1 Tax=Vicia villosa TaxID=3911 RepID=UPI00273AF307|nr:ankyrin repeat-containing protein BDA1-like [Vicia villosa]
MSTSNLDNLKAASNLGDIDLLYTVIQDDPSILDNIDSIQFVETPLHIAASRGHIQFSIEVMNLKPSFAWKLNPQGFSPIHLAMQNGEKRMVSRLVDMNKDLVRVKGREGFTPLHFASQIGEVAILTEFLSACPESIEDVTVRGETALHVAVKSNNYEAFHLLVTFLRTSMERGARKLEYKILNRKDEVDNTILHILVQRNFEPQVKDALGLLLKTKINIQAKNMDTKTAFDMSANVDIRSILLCAGAKPGLPVSNIPTHGHKPRSKTAIIDNGLIWIRSIRRDISEDQRNTWLIVVTLVATATYQSALSPPGGVYQANATDNTVNTFSNSTNAGKSVLSRNGFIVFSLANMVSFFASIIAIFILTPSGLVGALVFVPVGWFVVCYLFSMGKISPTCTNSIIVNIAMFSIGFLAFCSAIIVYFRLQQERNAKKKSRS